MKGHSLIGMIIFCAFFQTSLAFDGSSRPWLTMQPAPTELTPNSLTLFMLPDCGPCLTQLLDLVNATNRYGVPLVLATHADTPRWQEIIRLLDIGSEVIFDPDAALIRNLEIETVPALVAVDAGGLLRGVYQGVLTTGELYELAAALGTGISIPSYHAPGRLGSPVASPYPKPHCSPSIAWLARRAKRRFPNSCSLLAHIHICPFGLSRSTLKMK